MQYSTGVQCLGMQVTCAMHCLISLVSVHYFHNTHMSIIYYLSNKGLLHYDNLLLTRFPIIGLPLSRSS